MTLPTSFRRIIGRAWPIIVANAAGPLLGLADTAVIGRTGSVASLGAIAMGALVFSFVFWTFGFLRMGTTGFIAQADGSGDEVEVRATLGRALLMAGGIGLLLIAVQKPIFLLALALLGGSDAVKETTEVYLRIRIWGAPASLALFALNGSLIGLGRSRTLLALQVLMNGLNIVLDILFAGLMGMGVPGIALGTVLSEWVAASAGLVIMIRLLTNRNRDGDPFWSWPRILEPRLMIRTLLVQFDIMIRTLTLLVGFGWFTQQGARLGDVTLAANHILLQFMSFSAFVLDGFAFATESLVGVAAGRRQIGVFDLLVKRTSILAGVSALLLAVGFLFFGNTIIRALTDLQPVRLAAAQALVPAVIYIAVAVVAFQLDGIFIGLTRTRDMRNAALVSLMVFFAFCWWLVPTWGNTGLWVSFIAYVIARAGSLGALYPRMRRAVFGER